MGIITNKLIFTHIYYLHFFYPLVTCPESFTGATRFAPPPSVAKENLLALIKALLFAICLASIGGNFFFSIDPSHEYRQREKFYQSLEQEVLVRLKENLLYLAIGRLKTMRKIFAGVQR